MAYVYGIDFGALNSCIGIIRHGGVDIVLNEVSKRETASFVSFLGSERLIGESGYDRAVRNANNTCSLIKQLIGLKTSDPRYQYEKKFIFANHSADDEGRVQFNVDYNDEVISLYPEQILAMLLSKLRTYVLSATNTPIDSPKGAKDFVMSVPAWYNAHQRKLVMQACEMTGINCMSLINETTASGVDYGIFRQAALPETEEEATTVAFVDSGYAGCTITISRFWKGNMRVLTHAWDHELGTREADMAVYNWAAEEIKKKHRLDVSESKKSRLRLLLAAEKCKTALSANMQAPLNVENLQDIDVHLLLERAQFEEMIQPMRAKFEALLQRALQQAKITKDDVRSVEYIGGGCRIPMFKQIVADGFGKSINFTLNATETIAKGCTITAASFSPLFQMRPYVVHEVAMCPILLAYQSPSAKAISTVSFLPEVNKVMTILPEGAHFPKTLELTFERTDKFDLHVILDEEAAGKLGYVGCGRELLLGTYTIGQLAEGKEGNGSIKIRVRFHLSGAVTIDKATTQEKYTIEVVKKPPLPTDKKEDAATKEDEDAAKEEGEAPTGSPTVEKEIITKHRTVDLTVTPAMDILGRASTFVVQAMKAEAEMCARDLKIQRTKEVKNDFESYILDKRSKMREELGQFVLAVDKDKFIDLATKYEDWLYDEGDSADLVEYETRLKELKDIANPGLTRLKLSEDLPFAFKQFESAVNALKEKAHEKKGTHITEEEIEEAVKQLDELLAWGKGELDSYLASPKHETPQLAAHDFPNKFKPVEKEVKKIINKKPPPPPQEEEKPAEQPAEKDGDAAAPETVTPTGPQIPNDMD